MYTQRNYFYYEVKENGLNNGIVFANVYMTA